MKQCLQNQASQSNYHGFHVYTIPCIHDVSFGHVLPCTVFILQDLAVVVLLMLIPLLAPNPDGSVGGIATIAKALGLAAIKAVVAIVGIIAGGRMIVQPLYKKISEFANAEIFAATTLLVRFLGMCGSRSFALWAWSMWTGCVASFMSSCQLAEVLLLGTGCAETL